MPTTIKSPGIFIFTASDTHGNIARPAVLALTLSSGILRRTWIRSNLHSRISFASQFLAVRTIQNVLPQIVLALALSTGLFAAAPALAARSTTLAAILRPLAKAPEGLLPPPLLLQAPCAIRRLQAPPVIHFQHRPNHNYSYNPYKKQFWGRCPVETNREASYSLHAEKGRSGDTNKVAESAFPKPGKMPPIPESTDGATLDLPQTIYPRPTPFPRTTQAKDFSLSLWERAAVRVS